MSSTTFAPPHQFCGKELFCARKNVNVMNEKDKPLLHAGNFAMQSALGFYSNRRFDQDDCYECYRILIEPSGNEKDTPTSSSADIRPPGKKSDA